MRCVHCVSGQVREIGQTEYERRYFCPACRHTFSVDRPQPTKPESNPFICFNHQGKANALISALAPKYTQIVSEVYDRHALFVLTDNDIKSRQRQLEKIRLVGCNIFIVYPHSARPSMVNDHYRRWDHTTAQFVVNEYHAEVLRKSGYDKPLISIGWTLCPLREFQPRWARNVLFAPIHPRNAPQDRDVNARTFARLYPHALSGEINLTVRFVGDLLDNGLQREQGVTYIHGKMNQDFSEIDVADVVIGHQTVAWIAVARGVPTVMMAEDMPTHFRKPDQSYEDVKSWNKIHPLIKYPLDILAESNTMKLLNRAVRSDVEIADWRRRMIGDAFDPLKFAEIVEGYINR